MRLSEQTQHVISSTARQMFGDGVRIWLFGSRVDDAARGGDIDLLIETDVTLESRAAAAGRFNAKLQMSLGEQKIDILLVDAATPLLPIHQIARETGVRL